jgi:predicted AAA+ superfamily ATPase
LGGVLSQRVVDQNPWWADPAAIAADRDLVALAQTPLRFEPPVPIALDRDAIYGLRGPRQVGKTTLLKRIAAILLEQRGVSARALLYLDVERAGLLSYAALSEAIEGYLAWARPSPASLARERVFLLLDEVTAVPRWSTALKALHDSGALDGASVIATGSDVLDLDRGVDRLPGRRGRAPEADWVLMPWSFYDYVAVHDPQVASDLPVIPVEEPHRAFEAAQEIALRGAPLHALFTSFLQTGGFPHAAQSVRRAGRVEPHVYQLYEAAVLGEIRRAGRDESRVREVVRLLATRHLGREFSWQGLAAGTSIGNHTTARAYVEDLERTFVWHVWHRVKGAGSASEALRSPKKLYPVDPLTWHVIEGWALGVADRWAASLRAVAEPQRAGYLVEAVFASLLRRRFGHFAFYQRDRKGAAELDFVAFRDTRPACAIEAKWAAGVAPRDVPLLVKSGGGVVASLNELAWWPAQRVAVIPAAFLAAGFGPGHTLFPAPPA